MVWLAGQTYPNPPNALVLIGHANPVIFAKKTINELEEYIKKKTNWESGQPIILNGCNAGKGNNSIAEQLSKRLNGNTVVAPDNFVINIGPIDVGPYNVDANGDPDFNSPGEWKCFGLCIKH
jgi:hypothetical protein